MFKDAMDTLVYNSENGIVTKEQRELAKKLYEFSRPLPETTRPGLSNKQKR